MQIGSFKLEKPELKFSDLDVTYQNHFIKEFILTGLGFIGSIIFCILIRKWTYILICLAIAAGYTVYVLWQIYKSLANKVLVIDAKCIDIERKENKVLGSMSKEVTTSKTCTLILENEDG